MVAVRPCQGPHPVLKLQGESGGAVAIRTAPLKRTEIEMLMEERQKLPRGRHVRPALPNFLGAGVLLPFVDIDAPG